MKFEEFKVSREKKKPEHLISYKCPNCDREMRCNITLCQPYQLWSCDECKKTYELSFRELKEKK